MRFVVSNVTTWPAARIATAIRAREISCEEIVRAYLARIEEVNPKLNAVVQLWLERALVEVRNGDKAIAAMNSQALCTGFQSLSKITLIPRASSAPAERLAGDNGRKGKSFCKGKAGCASDGSKPQLS